MTTVMSTTVMKALTAGLKGGTEGGQRNNGKSSNVFELVSKIYERFFGILLAPCFTVITLIRQLGPACHR